MKGKLLAVIIFLFAAVAVGVYLNRQFLAVLLSPLTKELTDVSEFDPKLSQKLISDFQLDYSQTASPAGLTDIPRFLVYNPQSSRVYAAKNENLPFSPASFTKLLTAQVALDLINPNQLLTATKTSVAKEPTVLGLKAGEQLTLAELIRAAIATSANDAAATIAEGTARLYALDPAEFVSLMNRKALLLKMNDSRFANPEGYDDQNQYATLADIARLVANTQANYPSIIAAGRADNVDLAATATHGFYYLPNWNGLLNVHPAVTGLKIAYTENAGYSTIITADFQNIPVVVILSGAADLKRRDLAAAALLEFAYSQEKVNSPRVTQADLQLRYNQWIDLARKIRRELDALKQNESD